MDEREGGDPATDYPVTTEVSERVRSILAEAEAAATAIRREAEEQSRSSVRAARDEASRILAEARRQADDLVEERVRRISELSGSLAAGAESLVGRFDQAQNVQRQFDELVEALGEASGALLDEVAGEPASTEPEAAAERRFARPPAPVAEPAAAPAAAPEHAPAPPAPAPNGGSTPRPSNGHGQNGGDEYLAARLVAFQMALAGGSRGEVDGHLRRAFELDPPDWLLDDVFGAGSASDARVSWAEPAGRPAGA